MAKSERIYFPDEEPEKEYVEDPEWMEGCNYCGSYDHPRLECPTRPLSSWTYPHK